MDSRHTKARALKHHYALKSSLFFVLFFLFGTYKLPTFARALKHHYASRSSLFFVLFSNYCLADRGDDMCYFISLFNCRPMCNQGSTPFKLSTNITLFVFCMPMPTFKRCYFYNNSNETYHTHNKHVWNNLLMNFKSCIINRMWY